MSNLNEELVRNLVLKVSEPLVLKGFVSSWPVTNWNLDKWCTSFGDKKIPFRCMRKDYVGDEPCWERKCKVKSSTFEKFVESSAKSSDWMYFDYKHLHEWFSCDSELYKEVSWKKFGFAEKGAHESTLWVGSAGAHTPAHRDTYGCNIVAQLHGSKRWILFPPESGGMKPTRVPYEESSVYSELNFCCPSNLDAFKGLTGGRVVELNVGDALLVPHGWWHYVQNTAPVNIALNAWIPHDGDGSSRISEALIRVLVAQLCKDLPQSTQRILLNPNEDDLAETPLAVLFLQLETVAKSYLDSHRKERRAKRQRTTEGDDPKTSTPEEFDLESLLNNDANCLQLARPLTGEDIMDILRENVKLFAVAGSVADEDQVDGTTTKLCLTKAVIDAYSQTSVIEVVKQSLLARLA